MQTSTHVHTPNATNQQTRRERERETLLYHLQLEFSMFRWAACTEKNPVIFVFHPPHGGGLARLIRELTHLRQPQMTIDLCSLFNSNPVNIWGFQVGQMGAPFWTLSSSSGLPPFLWRAPCQYLLLQSGFLHQGTLPYRILSAVALNHGTCAGGCFDLQL